MTPSIPLAWLGTYLVHSTLLLGLAWIASRLLRRRSSDASLALEEGLWKATLVGGILTATLQVGVGLLAPAPLQRAAVLPAEVQSAAAPATTASATVPPAPERAAVDLATPHPVLAEPAALLPGWQRLVLGAWMVGALVGLALLGASWLRFGRTVRPRHEVTGGPPRRLLDRLVDACRTRRPVRLTGAERLPVPVALGLIGREICVPRRVLDGFGPRRQEALLAHELAHLERRDPAWLLTGGVIGSVLFFQPLNRLARIRLREIAEYRCDAWAVERTGDRVSLARCLTEVAGWLTGSEAAPAPGMASHRTALGHRVRRILEGPGRDDRSRRWVLPLSVAVLVAVGCLAPGVAPAQPDRPTAEPEPPTAAPSAPPAEAAPAAPASEPTAPTGGPAPEAPEAAEGPEAPDAPGDHDRLWVDDSEWEWNPREGDLDPELQAEIEEIERLAAEIARQAVPDPEALEAISAEAARIAERAAVIDGEAMTRLHEELARELAVLDDDGVHALSPEERERLEREVERIGEEIRLQADQARPSDEELERLRAMAERVRPNEQELERMERELERRARDLERRVLEEHRRTLDERRRELEERHEELRERAREVEERTGAEMEERRQELEERRTELEERRRELEEERREMEEEDSLKSEV